MKKIIYALVIVFSILTTSGFVFGETYKIGVGDVLGISVWKDDSLNHKIVVPPDGIIAFPLIGAVNVNNMTVRGLRRILTKHLSEYLPDVTVTVMLLNINSLKAYVIGKVNKPGMFDITMDTSVIQILAMAGGLNPFASETRINILRRQKKSTIKIPFNYKRVVKGEQLKQNIILKKGDVVVVP